jgi:hypothetical protein
MYFDTKNYLKNTRNHTGNHAQKLTRSAFDHNFFKKY